jgi:hypothetical protein
MGIREGARAFLVDAPASAIEVIELPRIELASAMRGSFDYIHLFVVDQRKLDEALARLKPHLGPGGMLWVSWPKGRQLGTDLTLRDVIRIGYDHGLVESTTLSIDAVWSGMKFTHPRPGRTYRNSYGQLPKA